MRRINVIENIINYYRLKVKNITKAIYDPVSTCKVIWIVIDRKEPGYSKVWLPQSNPEHQMRMFTNQSPLSPLIPKHIKNK